MKHRSIFLPFFFFLFSLFSSLHAQDVFNYPLRPQTEEAFVTTCSRLAQHKFIKGNFEQEKIMSRHNRSLKSSGNFIIAADLGMVWETIKPFPSTLALGRDFMIQSRPGRQRTVVNAQGNETFIRMADAISTVFSGDAQRLLNNFSVYYNSVAFSADSASGAWELGLTPLDKAITSIAGKIILKGDVAIRSIQIYDQNGDSIKYILLNHKYPAELNKDEQAFFSIN